jgi:hypothetical protein
MALQDSQTAIANMVEELKAFLLEKNQAYGDSALDPVRVFSSADMREQLLVRIDDKLSRLRRGNALPDETYDDTVRDLVGYLVLLLIARRSRR